MNWMERFDKVLKESLSYDIDDKTGDPLIRSAYWDIKNPLESFIENEIEEAEERGYQRGAGGSNCSECFFEKENGHSFGCSKYIE